MSQNDSSVVKGVKTFGRFSVKKGSALIKIIPELVNNKIAFKKFYFSFSFYKDKQILLQKKILADFKR